MESPAQQVQQIELVPGQHDSESILKVSGPLLISNFFDFQAAAREDKSKLLIIDLAGVPYMDSAALGSILGIHVSCGRKQSKYALIGLVPRVEKMFELSGVRDTLVIFATLAKAEAALLG